MKSEPDHSRIEPSAPADRPTPAASAPIAAAAVRIADAGAGPTSASSGAGRASGEKTTHAPPRGLPPARRFARLERQHVQFRRQFAQDPFQPGPGFGRIGPVAPAQQQAARQGRKEPIQSSPPTTCPSFRLPAAHQVSRSTPSATNSARPSPITAWAPPGWWLLAVTMLFPSSSPP